MPLSRPVPIVHRSTELGGEFQALWLRGGAVGERRGAGQDCIFLVYRSHLRDGSSALLRLPRAFAAEGERRVEGEEARTIVLDSSVLLDKYLGVLL